MVRVRTFSRILTLSATILVLSIANVTAVMPFVLSSRVDAVAGPEVVYDALPSVYPDTNYPSLGFQATSTSEFGDYIHLGGTNRKLDTVTVTMSNWAKYATYSSDPAYSSSGWSHPITLNVYDSHLGADGAPDTLLATRTQTFSIPWRPAEDPSCGTTSNGFGWKTDGTCYDFSGIAFNISYNLSDLGVALPSDIIVGIAYDTQSYRNPLGVGGPYNSLNVAIPGNQLVTVGSDDSADNVFWKNTYLGGANVFSQDTGWAPNGTVAMRITATSNAPAVPVHATPANGASINYNDFWFEWNDVSGAVSYEMQNSTSPDVDSSGSFQNVMWTGDYQGVQPIESKSRSVGASGTWYWQVRSVNATGEKSDWSSPWAITIDKTAPAAPTLNSPANNAVVNGVSLAQSWNASASDDVDHYIYESYNDSAAVSLRWSQPVSGLSKTADNVADTTFWWRVKAVDAAGNESSWSPIWKLSVDSTAPATPTLVTPDWYVANGATKNLKWNASSSSDVAYYEYAEYNHIAPASDTSPASWMKSVPSPITQTTDTAWGSDVKIFWRVRAVDTAGNKSAWSEIRTIITDRTKPTATIDSAVIEPGNKLSVTVIGQDNLSGVARIGFNLYDANNSTKIADLQTVDYTVHSLSETSTLLNFDLSSLSLTSGNYVIRAAVRDVAGNLSSQATYTINVDTDAPVLEFTLPVTGGATPTFKGTINDPNATILLTVGANTYDVVDIASDGAGGWTWQYALSTPLPAGTYPVYAVATDPMGNSFGQINAPSSYTVVTAPNLDRGSLNESPVLEEVDDELETQLVSTTETTVPNTIGPAALSEVLGTSTGEEDSDVEGVSAERTLAAAVDLDGSDGSVLGIAWYWWLIILAAATLFIWWIVAGFRRRQEV